MKSSTETIIAALRILANDIQSPDGVANSAIREAADRLEKLNGDKELVAWWSEAPEPIAWIYEKELEDGFTERTLSFGYAPEFEGKITPLYIPLCKRKPLSTDMIRLLWESTDKDNIEEFSRLIEKTHGIGEYESTI